MGYDHLHAPKNFKSLCLNMILPFLCFPLDSCFHHPLFQIRIVEMFFTFSYHSLHLFCSAGHKALKEHLLQIHMSVLLSSSQHCLNTVFLCFELSVLGPLYSVTSSHKGPMVFSHFSDITQSRCSVSPRLL